MHTAAAAGKRISPYEISIAPQPVIKSQRPLLLDTNLSSFGARAVMHPLHLMRVPKICLRNKGGPC